MKNKKQKRANHSLSDIYILSKILIIVTLSVCLLSLISLFLLTVLSDAFQVLFILSSMGTSISLILLSLNIGIGAAFALDYSENLKK